MLDVRHSMQSRIQLLLRRPMSDLGHRSKKIRTVAEILDFSLPYPVQNQIVDVLNPLQADVAGWLLSVVAVEHSLGLGIYRHL